MEFSFLTAGSIRFGRGVAAEVPDLTRQFGKRVLLVQGHSVAWVDTCRATLQDFGCLVTDCIQSGEPTTVDVDNAVALAGDAEVVLGIGGGAVLDLAKAAAAVIPNGASVRPYLDGTALQNAPLPFIAVPTTAGTGSEVTKNAVITIEDRGVKLSLRDPRMLADVAVVDPALTDHSPRSVTLASGLDAIVQCLEPILSRKANPLTDALAWQGAEKGAPALYRLAQSGAEDPLDRDDLALASLCGGLALANAGLGAVHGIAGVMGGETGAPHGLICGRLLGPILVENQAMLPDDPRLERIAELLRTAWGIGEFADIPALLDQWNVPRLGRWITPDTDLGGIATRASSASSMQTNPCVLSHEALVRAMEQAI